MIKDFLEDFIKVYSDLQTNTKKVTVIRNNKETQITWMNLRVGDVVKIGKKEAFPADLLMLDSSDVVGTAFVETSMLDGETDLKHRKCIEEVLVHFKTEKNYSDFHAKLMCDPPNNELYRFKGNLTVDGHKEISVPVESILLRGSSLRNTDWIVGVVIYSGHDTKIMKNRNSAPHKKSQLDVLTNKYVYLMFFIEIILCLACVIVLGIFNGLTVNSHWYLKTTYTDVGTLIYDLFVVFWTFFILFSNLVPISLYVSMETAKVIQGYFIAKDIAMYHTDGDIPAMVKTSSINEDLGQVSFIFSDKTGTLTANEMKFFKCCINGVGYGKGVTEIARAAAKKDGLEIEDPRPPEFVNPASLQFWDDRWNNGAWKNDPNADAILRFMKFVALCHTVIIETNSKGESSYSSTSPDEFALIDGMRLLGVEFIKRGLSTLQVKFEDQIEEYQILGILEFDSDRKRMSIILRFPDGKIHCLTKGADSVIWPLISSEDGKKETQSVLHTFAEEGLRTLVLGIVEIPEEKWERLSNEMKEAKKILDSKKSKESADKVALEIENDLILVGVTALEDKLQVGVPETITELKKAGIRIWVLTGDKLDTAENIGHACDLLNTGTSKYRFKDDKCSTKGKLFSALKDAFLVSGNRKNQGILIEGKVALKLVMEDETLKNLFLALAIRCEAVICCRVSPKQKADVVELVNKRLESGTVTLAIGDGGNDVSMIQSAKVGVGIAGKEGMQAANAADYSFGQFRFLRRLLIVHGRWSYRRIAKLILYSFYKNCVLYLTQFWYFWFSSYSGASIHDTWNISFFNLIFTALPIMALAIFDRDLDAGKAESFPNLYKQGQKRRFFKFGIFFTYVLNAIWHSLVCFFVPYFAVANYGYGIEQINIGFTIFTSVLFVVTIKVAMETGSYSIITWFCLLLSIVSWFAYYVIYANLYKAIEFYEWSAPLDAHLLMGTYTFWLTVLVTTAIALLRDVTWKFLKRMTSHEAYYTAIAAGKNVDLEAIAHGFPLEEGLPIRLRKEKLKERVTIPHILQATVGKELSEMREEMPDITRRLESLLGSRILEDSYSGFGFTVQDGASALLRDYYESKELAIVGDKNEYEKKQDDLRKEGENIMSFNKSKRDVTGDDLFVKEKKDIEVELKDVAFVDTPETKLIEKRKSHEGDDDDDLKEITI